MKKLSHLVTVLTVIITLAMLPVTMSSQANLRQPVVTTTGLLNLTWSAGTVNNGGKAVSITASSTNGTASRTDCAAPLYATCGWLYANSVGTVANTTTLATAAASGNTILAMYESNGTAITKLSFPLQNSGVGLAGLGVMTSPTLITPNIGAATGTSLDLTGSLDVGVTGTAAGTVVFQNATSGAVTVTPTTGALGTPTVTLPKQTGAIPTAYFCGATSGDAACANTATVGTGRVLGGLATLSSNAAVISGISPAFTGTTTFACVANDITTRANPVEVVNTSASSITITNTTGASDVIHYVCIGY